MTVGLDWARDGADWPNRDASRFVRAGGLEWHVQTFGDRGPALLLLHGTGAATHSWRGLAPNLAQDFRVIALDLPAHGFTGSPYPYQLSIPGMAALVEALLRELDVRPDVVVGHSAGAALAIRMTLDGRIAPRALIGLNAALKPFPGMAGLVFPAIARALVVNPVAPMMMALSARDAGRVARLLEATGSRVDDAGFAFYARLFRSRKHVAGALGMMAHWSLEPLVEAAPTLATPLTLIVGDADGTVPPSVSEAYARLAPSARAVRLPGLGHLAHEEAPAVVADAVRAAVDSVALSD